MDSLARVVILMTTVIALIYIFSHHPAPEPPRVEAAVIPFCPITLHIAGKDVFGNWHFRWVPDYGPCGLMDRYEEI